MWSSLGSLLELCILTNSIFFVIGPLKGAKMISIMIFRITTLSIITLSIKGLFVTFSIMTLSITINNALSLC
jgi:hypothetical protein